MKKLILAALLALVLVLPAQAMAKTYIVGVEAINYYPLYVGQGNTYKGFAAELLNEFAKKKGYTFKYKALPLKRLWNDFLNTDNLDLKFPDNAYWMGDAKKGKNVLYSEPAVDYIDGVSVLPANKGKGIASLKRLGIISGFTAWEYLDAIKAGKVKLNESSNYESLIQKGLKKRVDGVYSNVAVVRYQLAQEGKAGAMVYDPDLPHTKSSYYLSTRKHPELIREFNEFLKAETALIDKLKAKYQVSV